MYTDFRFAVRDQWLFPYKGKDLLLGAQRKLREVSLAEQNARRTMATLIVDPNIAASDRRIKEAKTEIETQAEIREKLIVFVHEFARNPKHEHRLSIGDVVFFLQVDSTLEV